MLLRLRHVACMTALALVAAGCGKSGPTADQIEGEKIAHASDCFACHAVDHKVVGPAFNDVAKKFANDPAGDATLIEAVQKGHTGTWGTVQMPPHPQLTQDQLRKVVGWVLIQNTVQAAAAQSAPPTKTYDYKTIDGQPVKANFQVFQDGTTKPTISVFHGYEQYNSYCFRCHGEDATGSSFAPDLRKSIANGMTLDQFNSVAMAGRKEKGMPSWAGFFTPEQVKEIYQYVEARQLNVIDVGIPEQ